MPPTNPMTDPSAAYNPPPAHAPVNPLGGTMAADASAFAAAFPMGAPPPPGGGFGAPPNAGMGGGPPPYGAPGDPYGGPPPGGAPGFGPPGFGQPPQQGYGGPPQDYGQPPQQFAPAASAYGAAPGYGGAPMGQPPQGMAPYGQPGAMPMPGPMAGTLQSAGTGSQPTRRNALMTWLVPGLVIFGGGIVSSILAMLITPSLSILGSLFALAGVVMYLLSAIKMANEIKSVTKNNAFAWWPIFIPIYSYYWLWFLVPAEVKRAKQMMGVQAPPRSIVLYVFLWHYALASDLNDMAR
ncbi:MAG TPA: hypothetical protein VGG39_24880 [Polyangiaceae bacterium]